MWEWCGGERSYNTKLSAEKHNEIGVECGRPSSLWICGRFLVDFKSTNGLIRNLDLRFPSKAMSQPLDFLIRN